jgi:hypothetical protein
MIMDGIELHWVIGYVQKISTFDAPACLQYHSSLHANFVGRPNQNIIVLSSTRGHFLVYFCRPRTLLSTTSAVISSAKFQGEKFHLFWASQDLSTWLPPAPRFWLEVPMYQYAGEHPDIVSRHTAVGKNLGTFPGAGYTRLG